MTTMRLASSVISAQKHQPHSLVDVFKASSETNWKVKPGRLVDEIDAVKDKIDPITWEAIDAVRKIGNIGAQIEKDINVIVDVDPNEAELLIGLIETLIRDWYIAREDRKKRLTMIKQVADSKSQAKQQKAPQS